MSTASRPTSIRPVHRVWRNLLPIYSWPELSEFAALALVLSTVVFLVDGPEASLVSLAVGILALLVPRFRNPPSKLITTLEQAAEVESALRAEEVWMRSLEDGRWRLREPIWILDWAHDSVEVRREGHCAVVVARRSILKRLAGKLKDSSAHR